MHQIPIDLTFPHDYEISLVDELPPGPSEIVHHYFPSQINRHGHDGITVKVKPNHGIAWLGTFTFGYENAFSGLFSCPNPNFFCIVSEGQGYIVEADEPDNREWVPFFPIYDARISVEQKLIVFTDLQRMMALGRNGEAWQSGQLSNDEIWEIKVTADTISGMGYSSPGCPIEFVLDLRTGKHQDGTRVR